MSLQKFVYCPCCGTLLRGRFCVQCGYDTEIVKESIGSRSGVSEDKRDTAEFIPITEPNESLKCVFTEPGCPEENALSGQDIGEDNIDSAFFNHSEDTTLCALAQDMEDKSLSSLAQETANTSLSALPQESDGDAQHTQKKDNRFFVASSQEKGESFFSESKSNGILFEESKPTVKVPRVSNVEFVARQSSQNQLSSQVKEKPKASEIVTKAMPYLGMLFAVISLLIMLAPYGSVAGSSQSNFCIYQLASAISEYGNLVILMILSNCFLFLISLHLRYGNLFIYGIIGSLCEILSLIGIGLLLSKFAEIKYFSVSAGIYAYLALTVCELLLFLTITAISISKLTPVKRNKSESRIKFSNRKKSVPKTKKILIAIVASVAGLAVIGVSIYCGFYFSNNFRAEKLDKIEIGALPETVESILGKPNVSTAFEWEYYDSGYKEMKRKVSKHMYSQDLEQLKLEQSLMKYRRISIRFYNNKVVSVEYDASHVDAQTSIAKIHKKIKFNPSTLKTRQVLTENSIVASIFYKDGSFHKYAIPYDDLQRINTMNVGYCAINWSDKWGSYYTTIKIEE